MKTKHTFARKHQQGLSLIELMISMVAGLFLLAGVVANFVSTQDNDRLRDAVSQMDADAAYALKTLRQTITHAGYGTTNNVRIEKPFLTDSDTDVDGESACIDSGGISSVNEFKTKDSGGRDNLTVIYLADNPCKNGANSCEADTSPNINEDALVFTDCSGGGASRIARDVSCSTDPGKGLSDPTEAKIYNTFRVVANSDRTLMCHGSRGGGQPVVDNVHAMQFLYGVRDEGTDSTAYRTADQVENSGRWGQVRSVKVGLLLRSSALNLVAGSATTIKYQVLDREVIIPAADGKRLYRLYTSTINLENLNKQMLGRPPAAQQGT